MQTTLADILDQAVTLLAQCRAEELETLATKAASLQSVALSAEEQMHARSKQQNLGTLLQATADSITLLERLRAGQEVVAWER